MVLIVSGVLAQDPGRLPQRPLRRALLTGPATRDDRGMVVFGWAVLFLVFLDEIAAVTAFGIWGWESAMLGVPGWVLVWLLPVLAASTWYWFASPEAPYGGTVVRPVAKVVVFGLATLALWDLGHHGWALALLVFSIVVNALAMLPGIRALTAGRDSA